MTDKKITDLFSLEDKVVVIVGGKGVYGNALTEAFAKAGARVFTGARRLEPLEANAAELRDEGYDVTAFPCDQADEESLFTFRDSIFKETDHIDALVLNAVARTTSDWNCPKEEYEESMKVNATGLFLATRTLGDTMVDQRHGSIIIIGSMQGMIGPDWTLYEGQNMFNAANAAPDYFFHKSGDINFARFCASHYGPYNIRVNCVSPGGRRSEHQTEVFAERYGVRTQLGRMAEPVDLVGTVMFLAMDASGYVTGTNIPVDGGYTAK